MNTGFTNKMHKKCDSLLTITSIHAKTDFTMKTETCTDTNCSRCNALFPEPPKGGGAAGYATLPDDSRICYACADAMQIEELKDRSKSFCAYVSSDGKQITTWTGGKLMDVTQSWPCALSRRSNWHDEKSYRCIRAKDVHGNRWYGRGSAGVVIKLRACK
jgi:hypothetical protein